MCSLGALQARQTLEVEGAPLLPVQRPRPERAQLAKRQAPQGGHEGEDVDWLTTSLLFLFPAIGGLLFGYDIGATSGALVSMTSQQYSGTDWYSLSAFQSGLVVSLSLAGALLGSGAALLYGDKLGRRRELLGASALYGAASLVVALAPGLPTVMAGRLLYGVGIGFAMHAAPAYIAETSPARVRGLLISLKEAFIVGGILAGYAASFVFVEQLGGWRWMYGLAAAPAVVLAAGMLWLPESPRWLLLSGAGPAAASAALRKAKGRTANEAVVQVGRRWCVCEGGGSQGLCSNFAELLRPRYRRPLAIGMSLMLFQQITGQPSVLYYAAKIFQAAGFAGAEEATGVSLVLGFFKLIMTGIAVATVDSWGRRPLLLYGVSGIVLSLLALGTAQVARDMVAWTNLVALLLYVGCYQLSFGPISWLLCGEVFPLKVRGQAIALATLTNFGSNFLVSLALPTITESFGPAATYFTFAAIGVGAVVTIHAIVPETKGKTLEEIEALWQK
ncbi:hypothetical protein CHLNCDRAFT_25635 [Chlorella variabilis]|uniref:Major facilitator superfamily (MFS) profile domain-containing protein n=1 Tax=Chlorella variabilis TaxID=554065 RepID=E1ZKZ3_CHLVA|nr:hypothetical protein CHLNCDRAFT_25635 [Chlorella variabilis]EFN53468.1 hypothetical protein CHLNCDRAFT_25635 [Chlorella variabilis]|eukprot:XP_005845570.1 hypothetical protein CHLNCDRAFT_25635 [Chlorella variabilis]